MPLWVLLLIRNPNCVFAVTVFVKKEQVPWPKFEWLFDF